MLPATLHTITPWAPDWVVALAVLLLVIAGGLAVQGLVLRILDRRKETWHPMVRALFRRTRGIVRFALVILAVAIAVPVTPMGGQTAAILNEALVAALVVLVGWAALLATDVAADHYLARLDVQMLDNLTARKMATQVSVLKQAANVLILIVTLALALMTFDSVRQIGITLFASAGIAGIAVGLAAQPVLKNLLAGLQLAIAQPIRIDDVVIVEGEWGRIEEIASTYVVVRIWDLRRMIVPLSYFLEKPFQNWTRTSSAILGTVFLYADYSVPVGRVREALTEIVKSSSNWDGKVAEIVVTDAKETTVELRALVSASDSSKAWDLRCEVREKLVAFIQEKYPASLPRYRGNLTVADLAPSPSRAERS